jgi:parallel beta-helix repeat protein
MKNIFRILFFILLTNCFLHISSAQKFLHPGINQTSADLALMKKMVMNGQRPYKDAFDRLKAATDTDFAVKPHTHVLRGPYGKPNIGGDDLSRSANMAYNYALVWYITNDKKYAQKAIEVLNTWSPVLWHFDYNDAKLLAAWTGHLLCNAAEILRYTNSGWQQKDIDAFINMLMSVYYPLLRNYYPQANGNWDGAIIHTILSIAIFTDNRKMFDNAVDHFLHAPVNGSMFKYIYPNGQCQETARDQGHVQLGLGEFAGAAQVAFTQGVDFFSMADNRIGLGYEFTAAYLLGEKPFSYMQISDRSKVLRDDYEYVYRHYSAKGVDLPFTKMAADSVRPKASRSILTSVRAWSTTSFAKAIPVRASSIGYIAGAGGSAKTNFPPDALVVNPGESVQSAVDAASGSGKWVVLKSGIHTIPKTLIIPSNVTIAGEGIDTKLFLDPASGEREAIINKDVDLHDVTIRDLVIECNTKTEIPSDPNSNRSYRGGYNRGGIIFRAVHEGQMKNISLLNITVQNGTYNGVFISGATQVNIIGVDLNENGGNVPPGAKLNHNLLLTHCSSLEIKGSRFSTSAFGCGIALEHCQDVSVTSCEVARNAYYGILVTESKNVSITNNLIEANDRTGVMIEFLQNGSDKISVSDNLIHFNNGYGVESYAARNLKVEKNKYAVNGNDKAQEKLSTEKFIIMQ